MLKINFTRSPVDECSLSCSETDCAEEFSPWPQPQMNHTLIVRARIGPSGDKRGYAAITGTISNLSLLLSNHIMYDTYCD